MRLLFLTNVFPNPRQPTKGVFNLELVRALAQEHSLQVVSPVAWVDAWRKFRLKQLAHHSSSRTSIEGVEIHYPRYYYPPKILREFYGKFLWLSISRKLWRCVNDSPPDAVISYWIHPDGEVGLRTARSLGVPSIVMTGGSDALLLAGTQGRRRRILDVLHGSDAVVAVGQDLKEKIIAFGIRQEKVYVVPRGVDNSLFTPGDRVAARHSLGFDSKVPLLLWVGRMVPVKGLRILLEACALLQQQGVPFQLCLVGDGPLRQSLQASCKSRGLTKNVTFAGPVTHDQLPLWYQASNVTVLPSLSEGVPNVLRESLACETPFVASRVGGIPELARGSWDQLVPPGDPVALADGILRVLHEKHQAPCPPRQSAGWDASARSLTRIIDACIKATKDIGPFDKADSPIMDKRPEAPSRWRFARQFLRNAMAATLPRRLFLVRESAGCRSVCLTFDDGPDPRYTPPLLDALRKHDIVATFFVVGRQAERYPELVRRMASEGHVVAHHSFYHRQPDATTAGQLIAEVGRTHRVLTEILGKAPSNLFRPPHGKLTPMKLLSLWRGGHPVVLWNVDPKDYARRSADEVREWFRSHPLSAGDVVLMHDRFSYGAEVLPELVEQARESHLTFTTPLSWME